MLYDQGDVIHDIARVVESAGAPFDLVLDTVSSHDARDRSHAYMHRIRNHSPALLNTSASADPHNYVTIGAKTSGWVLAGIKRICGLNMFAKGTELFGIRFPHSIADLAELRRLADEGGVRPTISAALPLTDAGLQEGFRELHSRRVVGKLVVDVGEA